MRPSAPWLALLLAASLAALAGCSTRQDKLLANKRLIRGTEGFGTTTRLVLTPDRDTYLGTGKAFFSPTLLVGLDGGLEAQSYYSTSAWSLPPSSIPQDSIESIDVILPADARAELPATTVLALSLNAGPFDSSKVWGEAGGPTPGAPIAQFDVSGVGPIRFSIPTAYFSQFQGWAAAPATFPGWALSRVTGSGIVKLAAGAGKVRFRYFNRPAGKITADSIDTALPRHFTIRSPLAPAPTGTETSLILGGDFNAGLAVRFPPVNVPAGSTVNETTLRLRLDPSTVPFPADSDTVRIFVQRIDSPWAESEVQRDSTSNHPSGLKLDTATLGVRSAIHVSAGDSVISIALPPSIVRYWAAPGAVNEGILILIAQPYYTPPILVRSRESLLPIELRVSYTGPPPPKF